VEARIECADSDEDGQHRDMPGTCYRYDADLTGITAMGGPSSPFGHLPKKRYD
jgi:hypothetical protein